MHETENAGRAEFQFDDDVVDRRAARWAIDFGIAIDMDGSTIHVNPNLARVMRKAIECAESDRATLGTSDMGVRICAQCSGGMSDGRCQSCYWSPTDIDGSDGSTPTLAARRLDGQLNRGVVVSHCALLGGSGVPLLVGTEPDLTFTEVGLDLSRHKLDSRCGMCPGPNCTDCGSAGPVPSRRMPGWPVAASDFRVPRRVLPQPG